MSTYYISAGSTVVGVSAESLAGRSTENFARRTDRDRDGCRDCCSGCCDWRWCRFRTGCDAPA